MTGEQRAASARRRQVRWRDRARVSKRGPPCLDAVLASRSAFWKTSSLAKENQGNPSKKALDSFGTRSDFLSSAWLSLDFFVRFRAFNGLRTISTRKIFRPRRAEAYFLVKSKFGALIYGSSLHGPSLSLRPARQSDKVNISMDCAGRQEQTEDTLGFGLTRWKEPIPGRLFLGFCYPGLCSGYPELWRNVPRLGFSGPPAGYSREERRRGQFRPIRGQGDWTSGTEAGSTDNFWIGGRISGSRSAGVCHSSSSGQDQDKG